MTIIDPVHRFHAHPIQYSLVRHISYTERELLPLYKVLDTKVEPGPKVTILCIRQSITRHVAIEPSIVMLRLRASAQVARVKLTRYHEICWEIERFLLWVYSLKLV